MIKEKFFLQKVDDEIPQSKELAPDVDRIKKVVCGYYRIDENDLLQSRRGFFHEPRNVAIYLTRRLRGDSLKQIGEQYRMNKYSSVSSVIERMKVLIAQDRRLKKKIKNLISAISKSQEQT